MALVLFFLLSLHTAAEFSPSCSLSPGCLQEPHHPDPSKNSSLASASSRVKPKPFSKAYQGPCPGPALSVSPASSLLHHTPFILFRSNSMSSLLPLCLLHAVYLVWKPFSNPLAPITHSSSLNLKDTSSRKPSFILQTGGNQPPSLALTSHTHSIVSLLCWPYCLVCFLC